MSKGFYIDINSIMDTRAGVIKRLNPDGYTEIIRNGYHQRKGDFFEGIDVEAFKKMYEANEDETIFESTITNVFYFLYPHIADAMKEHSARDTEAHVRPTLDVNVWPYDFDEDAMAFVRTLVYQKMRGIVGVNVIRKDIKDLRPGYCAENYFMMVSYDYHNYLNTHSTELIRTPKPYLILIAPMVYFNTNPDKDEETIEQLKQGTNSLALLEAAIASRICLKFVNVDVFSIVYPDERVLKTATDDKDTCITIEELDKILLQHKDAGKRIPEA